VSPTFLFACTYSNIGPIACLNSAKFFMGAFFLFSAEKKRKRRKELEKEQS
jgi:hypothetical protein